MAELVKPWNVGEGSLTVAYDGDRDGSAVFSSIENEGIDREIGVSFVDRDRNVVVERKVSQVGLREVFRCADGDFILADGGTFNVLKSSLPHGYTELECLVGDGAKYVTTDFYPTYATKIVTDVSDIPSGSAGLLYGARDTDSGTSPRQFAWYLRSVNKFRAYYFGKNADSAVVDGVTRTIIVQDRNVTTAYGQTVTLAAATSGNVSYPLMIFTINNVGTPSTTKAKAKIYSMKIYDNDVLVRDFVPCQNAEGVSGLWCKVMKTFYPLQE